MDSFNVSNPKISVNWNQLTDYCKELALKIKNRNTKYKGIVIVSRGGLGIATILSRLLDIYLLEIICINSYNYYTNTKGKLKLIKSADLALKDNGKNWLIVDDLIDSGDTYEYIKNIFKEADFACLFHKIENNKNLKDAIFVKTCPKNSWIEFPWEALIQ